MEQNFSLTPVHTDKQIQEISNLASGNFQSCFCYLA